jgi:hypothetical protein
MNRQRIERTLFWMVWWPFVAFLWAFTRWACALGLLVCLGCVAVPQWCVDTKTGEARRFKTQQYVDEYNRPVGPPSIPDVEGLLGPPVFQTPPLRGPMFGMPPAVSPDGSSMTPFIGPDGVVLCNSANGVTVCQ